jgi:hypothetical protein
MNPGIEQGNSGAGNQVFCKDPTHWLEDQAASYELYGDPLLKEARRITRPIICPVFLCEAGK